MAKKWNAPPDRVDGNERIGRRLFDEPMLRGTAGQKPFAGLQINHFMETRSADVSLDRLGATSLHPKTIEFLTPRAVEAGKKFQKPVKFDGWAHIVAKELARGRTKDQPQVEVVASPVDEPEPGDNPYHAHVVRPNDITAYYFALHLRQMFTTSGDVYRLDDGPPEGILRRWWVLAKSTATRIQRLLS